MREGGHEGGRSRGREVMREGEWQDGRGRERCVRRCKCSVATALTGNTGGRRMRAPHLAALLLQVKLVRVVPGLLAPETTREERLTWPAQCEADRGGRQDCASGEAGFALVRRAQWVCA